MSGPWDRPPSSNPDDGEWPADDVGRGSSPDRAADPWSADDPWQERAERPSDWDVWPSPSQPPEEYVVPEPEPPANDPWAESWTDEVPGIPSSPPPGDWTSEPDDGPRPEPFPPEPTWTDAPAEPSPPFSRSETAVDEAPSPALVEPPPPRIQPWSPDPDPWGAATVDEWTWAEQAAHDEPEEAPSPPPAEPERITAEPEERPEPIAGHTSEQVAPAVPDDQPFDVGATLDAEPADPGTPEFEPAPEPELAPEPSLPPSEWSPPSLRGAVVEFEPDVLPEPTEPEPSPEPEPPAELEAEPEPEPEPEPEREADAAPEPEPEAVAEAAPEPEPEPAVESEVAHEVEGPAEGLSESDAAAELETQPASLVSESPATVDEPLAPPTEGDSSQRPWENDPWPETGTPFAPFLDTPAASAPAVSKSEPWARAEADVVEPAEADAAAAAAPAPADRAEIQWPESAESTQVLPTSWAPPVPEPREPEAERDRFEPSAGEVRTTLRRDETDVDDEPAAEPTTAEQAVPWLIGVILLLAGMVIVLLALIFAGDASLGGGGAVPSASAEGFVPEPSLRAIANATTSAAPTASAEASTTPAATTTPEPGPRYGDLEMVYQGRAAALAPIFLLRRDFTVEGDATVLAQDPNLDVRRFAWSADGTAGAGIFAELLLAIDPGVDRRPIAEDIVAVTFGEDAKTVYAVRTGRDGGDDAAAVVAVNWRSGDEEEIARVTYRRPDAESQSPLAEAQFTDDGGPVRLYWMEDGVLRLWVRNGGAWTIDLDGEVTEDRDGDAPLLYAPDGERRIGRSLDGRSTTLRLVDRSGDELATTTVTGRVSHLRWSPAGNQVVFTLGTSTRNGGIMQDLFLWSLGEGEEPDPVRLTNTGAAFGAEWLGAMPRWEAP